VVVTATRQILSAGGTESLPILTCSVMENANLELLDQLRWMKGNRLLALTKESGIVTFDTASIDSTFPQESHFGTYQCEAFNDQDKTEESIHIAERGKHSNCHLSLTIATCHNDIKFISDSAAQLSMQLQSLSDISCVRMPKLLSALFYLAIFFFYTLA
jgi:hypothetical protein